MSGRIPAEAIRDIRDRINLVELISETVGLRKRGRNYLGLCPFHTENTPSFTVSEDRGFFHCFGCGASGDPFAWLMRTEQATFPEAVRRLAERAGVRLPAPIEGGRDRRADDALYRITEAAAAFYQRALWEGAGGAVVRAYLGERAVGEDVARRYALGYAPPTGDALVRALRAAGHPVEAALAAGVAARRGDGTLFDRFRARLVFPIRDASGRVAGFGGRVLPGAPADAPKYVNSAESAIYRKGHLVYGLHEARDAIRRRDRAIVVEGYLDVLSLVQAGIGDAVAPLGTALTSDQVRLLRRHTGNIVACFDGDDAGRRAAARSFPVFVEAGLWGLGAFLPGGDDPDSFVRAHGAEAFERVTAAAVPLIDAFLRGLVAPNDPSVPRRAQAAREVARLLRRVRNPFEYDVLARLAAERLGVREDLLREEGSPAAERTTAAPPARGPRAESEGLLIELMLTGGDAVERVARDGGLSLFETPAWRSLAEEVLRCVAEGVETAPLVERLPAEMRARVAVALLGDAPVAVDRGRLLDDCMVFIERRRQRRRVRDVLEEIRVAEASGDDRGMRDGLRRWQELVGGGADAGGMLEKERE
jgi:DNA primase